MTIGAAMCGIAPPPFTMRTLPSASVISSSETFDSDTRSINVLSLRRSMSQLLVVLRRCGNLQHFAANPGLRHAFLLFAKTGLDSLGAAATRGPATGGRGRLPRADP